MPICVRPATNWLRPAVMTVLAVVLAEALVRLERAIELPEWLSDLVYAGGIPGDPYATLPAPGAISLVVGQLLGGDLDGE